MPTLAVVNVAVPVPQLVTAEGCVLMVGVQGIEGVAVLVPVAKSKVHVNAGSPVTGSVNSMVTLPALGKLVP